MDNKTINISKASKYLNVTNRTLRYYESVGLINTPQKNVENKYREYTKQDINNIEKVLFLKNMGLSLIEIKDYLKTNNPEYLNKYMKEQFNKFEALRRLINGKEIGKSINIKTEFKNDSQLLGLWEFETSAKSMKDYLAGNYTDTFYPYKKLCFKPNGESSWFYKWNKGMIIFNTWYLPEVSKYKIDVKAGKLFISIQNPSRHIYINDKKLKTSNQPEIIVFNKIKTDNIADSDIYYSDNINLPFKADKKAVGVWKIKNKSCGIIITANGEVYEFNEPNSENKLFKAKLKHTKNNILDLTNNASMLYKIDEENGVKKLTLEKKGRVYKNTGLIENILIFEKI